MHILVTGGCGFIGSHVTDELVRRGHEVVVFDIKPPPIYQNPKAEYLKGDICGNLDVVLRYKFDVVFHFAAEVGSGLSMADPQKYFRTNTLGTANLLETLRKTPKYPKVIVASSATVLGETTCNCQKHGIVYPSLRPLDQLDQGDWELKCPECRRDVKPVAMNEDRILKPTSIYGQSKLDQEVMCLLLGRAWGFPAVAFRFFAVYGPRQSLCNPYTGVLALFATRVFAGLPIMHYEDGKQAKDYIYIDDVVNALMISLESSKANGKVFNLGTGQATTIINVAQKLTALINPSQRIITTGKYRPGDTRHGWADRSLAKKVLNWEPKVSFDEGLEFMVNWLKTIPSEDIQSSVSFFEQAEQYAKTFGMEL